MTGFYTHRKTIRLASKIGPDAYWLPPRIWAYCAENQPDGDLSGYQADELAMLVAYKGDASSMLVALKDCGFMDLDGMIHDWIEHNGYHEKYSTRAKTAAAARWSKEKSPAPLKKVQGKEERGDKHCLEHACSMLVASNHPAPLPISQVFDEWNKLDVVPKCLLVSDKRRRLLEIRLREPFFAANWKPAMDKIKTSKFCQGDNDRGWKASFDWLLQPDTCAKLMEGKYDRTQTHQRTVKENPRNAGTCKPVTDYAQAAILKQQRQREEREARNGENKMGGEVAQNGSTPPAIARSGL